MRNRLFPEAPLFWLAISMMAGIVLGHQSEVAVPVMLTVLAGLLGIAWLLWQFPRLQSAVIVACFVVLGILLVNRQRQSLAVAWPDGEVSYEAVVLSEPLEKPKTMAMDILLTGSRQKLKCYIYKDSLSRTLHIGDGLEARSRIRGNSGWREGTFDYHRYLEIHGFTGSTFVPSWKWRRVRISLKAVSRLERTKLFFLKQRRRLLQRMAVHGMEGEAYGVVAAMVLGDKSALSKELKTVYSQTGASHVLALSGLHLGIIYTLLSLLTAGRRWQLFSQCMIILSVWAFVFLVGLSASVVRSAVMLSIYALMSLGHRDRLSVNTLAFTAMVMLMINPLSLYDVGFQLSFLAVFSIILFLPVFNRLVSEPFLMRHRLLRWSWGLVVVSCAAQIGVAPLIAYYFGRFSIAFLLTNFLVVPAVTCILYLSVIVLFVPSSTFLLKYIIEGLNGLLTRMAAIPGVSLEGLHPSLLQVWMIYVVIVAIYLLLSFRE